MAGTKRYFAGACLAITIAMSSLVGACGGSDSGRNAPPTTRSEQPEQNGPQSGPNPAGPEPANPSNPPNG